MVNYKTAARVVASLRSLVPEIAARPSTRVVVVDNCSGDGSADRIDAAIAAEGWTGWASVSRAPRNGGFSYGNNQAIRPALAGAEPPDLVWMLNPDTEVRPGALGALVAFLAAHPRVGIAGSSLYVESGACWPHAFRFPTLWSEVASGLRLGLADALLKRHAVLLDMGSEPAPVDWLPGASMMVRREVFDAVGLLDEGYFLYYEETDFCLAARRAGWECWYVPASRVMHVAGESTGVSGERAALNRRPAYWFDSRRRYFVKNHGRLYAAVTDLAWALSYATLALRSALQRRPTDHPPHYGRDLLRHSALFHAGMPGNSRLDGAGASKGQG